MNILSFEACNENTIQILTCAFAVIAKASAICAISEVNLRHGGTAPKAELLI